MTDDKAYITELTSAPKGMTEETAAAGISTCINNAGDRIALAMINEENVVMAWTTMSLTDLRDFANYLLEKVTGEVPNAKPN